MMALDKANATRLRRAEVKRLLKQGHMRLADALADPHVATMRVYDLLTFLPVNGPSKSAKPSTRAVHTAGKLLRACEASHMTTVAGLGERRTRLLLDAVADALGDRA